MSYTYVYDIHIFPIWYGGSVCVKFVYFDNVCYVRGTAEGVKEKKCLHCSNLIKREREKKDLSNHGSSVINENQT